MCNYFCDVISSQHFHMRKKNDDSTRQVKSARKTDSSQSGKLAKSGIKMASFSLGHELDKIF